MVPAWAKTSVRVISLTPRKDLAPVISRCMLLGTSRMTSWAGRLIAGIVCMVRLPWPTGARKVTRPPTLVRTRMSRSGPPLFRMTR